MAQSPLRLIRRCAEYKSQAELASLPRGLRGLYVLYRSTKRGGQQKYNVVYVGMTSGGERGMLRRLRSHRKKKEGLWTHFSVFEVWPNIRDEEIRELEGLFRHIYRKDAQANSLNIVRGFKAIRRISNQPLPDWKIDKTESYDRKASRRAKRTRTSRRKR